MRVKTRGPDGGSDFRTKEPVDQGPDDHRGQEPYDKDGLGIVKAQGFHIGKRCFLSQKGNIGFTHNTQVDGIKGNHGKDSCKQRRDAKLRVKKSRHDACNAAQKTSGKQGQQGMMVPDQEIDTNGGTQGKGPFDGHIGKIKDPERDVDTKSQEGPQKSLGESGNYQINHNGCCLLYRS